MKNFSCKYCGKEFYHGFQVAAHTSMCKANPNSRPNKIERKYITLNKICPKCGKEFSVEILESSYLKGNDYTKTYCSSSCANGHKHSEQTKEKIGEGVRKYNDEHLKPNKYKTVSYVPNKQNPSYIKHICRCCGKEYYTDQKLIFCSEECANKGLRLVCNYCKKEFYMPKFRYYCSDECRRAGMHDKLSEAARRSVAKQSSTRRSKAEKMFCELCENHFNKVTHNDPIFNGWDADVLIWDYKIAVLWNGKWHYEQITKNHSVEQVQNRDRIKCQEIKNKGWTYYIIKDLGKFKKSFVKEEFEKFIKYISRC